MSKKFKVCSYIISALAIIGALVWAVVLWILIQDEGVESVNGLVIASIVIIANIFAGIYNLRKPQFRTILLLSFVVLFDLISFVAGRV